MSNDDIVTLFDILPWRCHGPINTEMLTDQISYSISLWNILNQFDLYNEQYQRNNKTQ